MQHRCYYHTIRRLGFALYLLPGISVHILKLNRVRNLLSVLILRPAKRIIEGEQPVSVVVRRHGFRVKLFRPVIQIHSRICRAVSYLIIIVIPDNITFDVHLRRCMLMLIHSEVSDVLIFHVVCHSSRIAFYLDLSRVLISNSVIIFIRNIIKYCQIVICGACLNGLVRFPVLKQLHVYIFRTDTIAVIVIIKLILHCNST